jgi:hypothetical protein
MQPPEKEIIGKTKKKTKNLTIVHNQRNEKFFYFRNLKKFHQRLRERRLEPSGFKTFIAFGVAPNGLLFLLPNDCGHDGFLVGVWMSDHVHNTAHVNQFPLSSGGKLYGGRGKFKKICFAKGGKCCFTFWSENGRRGVKVRRSVVTHQHG